MNIRLVHGVGFTDEPCQSWSESKGKNIICNYYSTWNHMLERCYSPVYQKKQPSYVGCKVVESWHTLSNFKRWMEKQDWQGKQLDKDLLVKGNRVYSPETCAFVDPLTNKFANDYYRGRGECLIGVYFKHERKRYYALCCNPFTKKQESLGGYSDEIDAHLAWKKRKHELACQLADLQTDDRVANALRTRYL